MIHVGCIGIIRIYLGGNGADGYFYQPDILHIGGWTSVSFGVEEIQTFDILHHGLLGAVAGPPQSLDAARLINVVHDVLIVI